MHVSRVHGLFGLSGVAPDSRAWQASCCTVAVKGAASAAGHPEGEPRPSHDMYETLIPRTSGFTSAQIAVDPAGAVVQMLQLCSCTVMHLTVGSYASVVLHDEGMHPV